MSDETKKPGGIAEGGSYRKTRDGDTPTLVERTKEAPHPNEAVTAPEPAPTPKPAPAKPLAPLKTTEKE